MRSPPTRKPILNPAAQRACDKPTPVTGWDLARPEALHELQALDAIGQMGLIQSYESCFMESGTHTAQVLLTSEDISDRGRVRSIQHFTKADRRCRTGREFHSQRCRPIQDAWFGKH